MDGTGLFYTLMGSCERGSLGLTSSGDVIGLGPYNVMDSRCASHYLPVFLLVVDVGFNSNTPPQQVREITFLTPISSLSFLNAFLFSNLVSRLAIISSVGQYFILTFPDLTNSLIQ